MISIILFILLPVGVSLLVFLVVSFIIVPLISTKVRKFEPQDDWLTTDGIVDAGVGAEKKRWYPTRSRAFYIEIPTYRADIRITYLVNGQSYVVRPVLSFNNEVGTFSRDQAKELAAKYQDGKHVKVRYDPRHPQHAVVIGVE